MNVLLKSLFYRLSGLMVLLLVGSQIFGQQAAILIIDAKTKEPVQYASVSFQGIKSVALLQNVTDKFGKVPNGIKEKSKIAVSFIGYETLWDTIDPGISKTLQLVPSVLNMDEVVITAQFQPEKADKSIYKINVINSRQIERKAATNLTDLLSSESNMRISQGGVLG
jgi:outer membrane receptor for ferrienterochelin and colicins